MPDSVSQIESETKSKAIKCALDECSNLATETYEFTKIGSFTIPICKDCLYRNK